jgi:hypothetical protein
MKNLVEPERSQMTKSWVIKATRFLADACASALEPTHTQICNIIAFPQQKKEFRKRASMLCTLSVLLF